MVGLAGKGNLDMPARDRRSSEIFWTLLRESAVVRTTITVLLLATVIILVVQGQPVPDSVDRSMMLILGFYFGTKSNAAVRSATAEAYTNIATVVEAMNKKQ